MNTENREQRVESRKQKAEGRVETGVFYDEVSTGAPKLAVLLALLKLFTLEQLMFLVNHCETAVKATGFARVEIVFENGHVAFLYPAAGLRFPKPKGGE